MDKTALWKKEKESINYEKNKKYKGPTDWYTEKPASLQEKNEEYNTGPDYSGIKYDPQKIKENRKKQSESENDENYSGSSGGTIDRDPEIENPEFEEDEKENEKDSPPLISEKVWNVLGILLLIVLIILIVYYVIKNKQPKNSKVPIHSDEKVWNPAAISKTELELLLEKATEEENYRECVRIYFTFILKELIKKGWIKWKQEKTNFDYILEMKSKPNSFQFEECVRIYDLVWYGEYDIDKMVYESIQPTLLSYCTTLQASPQNGKGTK